MNLWKKQYTLRSYTRQKAKRGYVSKTYTDRIVSLDIQPLTASTSTVGAEGSRTPEKIVAYGESIIKTSDARNGILADRVFYNGEWYECESSEFYGNTPLAHFVSNFVKVPESTPAPAAPVKEESNGDT